MAVISSLESRFLVTKLIIGAAIYLCAGALIRGFAFGALASDTTATAFLRLRNPADLIAIAGERVRSPLTTRTTPGNSSRGKSLT
jgi:hypothetical protein